MKWFLRFFFTLVIIAGWVALGYFYVTFTLGAPKRDKPVQIEIPPHTSIQEIGQILKENKLIRESYFFRYYAIYKKKTNLKAGVYEIEPDEDLLHMLVKFTNGDQNVIQVTIPPGFDAKQVADRLTHHGFDGEGFLKLLNNHSPKYEFEKQIPENPKRHYKLEGYLYPNTYSFRKDAKPDQILEAMLQEFEKKVEKLHAYDKLKTNTYIKGSQLTIDQWVTVASLIQREGQVKSELPLIASVIYNRLNDPTNNKLQIDATIVYIYNMNKGERISKPKAIASQLKTPDPYNTYLNPGLPPGPISSPTDDALQAALNPAKTKYEFYVTRSDGSNMHYFAETYSEHERNIALSRKNEAKFSKQ
jgi:UPF0755 protein